MTDPNARERILEAAEARARTAGYHGFSFRDLADDVGIKSSSVHYHFPTKADLVQALAHRYTEKAVAMLGDPAALSAVDAIQRVIGLFRSALVVDNRMCLCGMLGAERDSLPPAVAQEVARFFATLLGFLENALGSDPPHPPAQILATLEGALILARMLDKPALFEAAIDGYPTDARAIPPSR